MQSSPRRLTITSKPCCSGTYFLEGYFSDSTFIRYSIKWSDREVISEKLSSPALVIRAGLRLKRKSRLCNSLEQLKLLVGDGRRESFMDLYVTSLGGQEVSGNRIILKNNSLPTGSLCGYAEDY
ncbi:19106_t:CDS:2 [Cetraspora pellucida]|uniref:19106_t:CDS:1 n=1 Tax=Cetraspora pellucida TaxID=1433469 RepID=A0A9N9J623_9GLOM|nr:19106_t:CDS:2 [Cetraspora pellucida]